MSDGCGRVRLFSTLGGGEMIEIKNHPYFPACQLHPGPMSKPTQTHPPFRSFVAVCLTRARDRRSVTERA